MSRSDPPAIVEPAPRIKWISKLIVRAYFKLVHQYEALGLEHLPPRGPVFVLTNHPRTSITMSGGTIFHFVTDGIHAAMQRAVAAADGKDIRLGGGVATIRQYLRAGLIDELHLAISPVLLGAGEHLLAGIDMPKLGYQCTAHVPTAKATHVVLTRRS